MAPYTASPGIIKPFPLVPVMYSTRDLQVPGCAPEVQVFVWLAGEAAVIPF